MMELALQQVVNGLMVGAIYAVMALGLMVILGILGVINMAQGELYMLGGYFSYFAIALLGVDYFTSIGLAMLLTAAAGVVLERGAFGIPMPTGREFVVRAEAPTIVLVPLVAWDATGVRLGRGGGFYDRTLAALAERCCLVGLGYAFQQCLAVPWEPWDVRLDYAVTEHRVVRCRSGDGASPMRKEDTTDNDLCIDDGRQHCSGGRPGVADRLSPPPAA